MNDPIRLFIGSSANGRSDIDSVETERIRVISSMMKGFMKMSGMFYRRVV